MTSEHELNQQLKQLGLSFKYWGSNEIKHLRMALTDGETVQNCINGHYVGGFAMLVATNQRLLLIDSKPMFLTIEAIWYDKIGQIDFNNRLLSAAICISTPNKELNFTTWNGKRLHEVLLYSQRKMAEAKGMATVLNEKYNNALERSESRMTELVAQTQSDPLQIDSSSVASNNEQEPQTVEQLKPHMYIPSMPETPTQYDLTLYTATHLPFSRRRYYSRSTS